MDSFDGTWEVLDAYDKRSSTTGATCQRSHYLPVATAQRPCTEFRRGAVGVQQR